MHVGSHETKAASSRLEEETVEAGRPAATSECSEPPEDTVIVGTERERTRGLEPGDEFNQYELIRELGRGGIGSVFLARDRKLGRKVAMKFLASSDAETNERFVAEAAVTARCTHENIVVIHEIDELRGRPFMVMEYLEGETLRKSLEAGRVPVPRVVEQMVPVVRAMVRAHEFGIVHCDLKPENIVVTRSGLIKVLDFGIAQLLGTPTMGSRERAVAPFAADTTDSGSGSGRIRGTLRYMSPEQYGLDVVDHRSDIWAIGVIMYEMASGQHHLAGLSKEQMIRRMRDLDRATPSLAEVAPGVPTEFAALVDRCLAKRKQDRFPDAASLLEALEELLPGRRARRLAAGENPYPGLTAFQERDADRFFGRDHDVERVLAQLRDHSLVGIVGPSGVGKSSFVRAGLIPALRRARGNLDVLIVRPGRRPMGALADLLEGVTQTTHKRLVEDEALVDRLRREPGYVGTLLRERARESATEIVLFVDQFEELYTLVPDPDERARLVACLGAIADDPGAPLRVVVSLRSDFLDRVAENQTFMESLTRGLVFLRPPDRSGLEQALTEPLRSEGYRFESDAIVDEMLTSLETTPGALPLLQFAAAKLWHGRDRERKLITTYSYRSMGGIEGTLSSHADDVLTKLPAHAQQTVKAIFQRLVTPEGTRAIVGNDELQALSARPEEVQHVLDVLVDGRLLVVQHHGDADGASFEIVHESLITSWPTLRRWLDENHEDSAFLAQLRVVAKQWDDKGRPQGLLWRGEAMEEARHWSRRYTGTLPPRERDYIDAVLGLATRSRRLRRALATAAVTLLLAVATGATIALVWIRDAQQVAVREAERARAAEQMITEKLRVIEAEVAARREAERAVSASQEELKRKNEELTDALDHAKEQRAFAERQQSLAEDRRREAAAEAARAREAEATVGRLAADLQAEKAKLEELLEQERARVEKLERQRVRINVGGLKKQYGDEASP